MSRLFGHFLFNLPLEKQRKQYAKTFINFFNRICRSQNIEVRKNAAINLPCFFYYYGNFEDSELDFIEIYTEYSQDDNIEIREIIAKGIHEVLDLIEKSGKNPFIMEETYLNLLKQSHNSLTVQLALSQNIGNSLGTFLRAFSVEILNVGATFETFIDSTLKNENAGDLVELYQLIREMLEEVIKLNEVLVKEQKNWRQHARFYEEMSKIIDIIPLTMISEIFDNFIPPIYEIMKKGSEQLKQSSSLLAMTMIFYYPNS